MIALISLRIMFGGTISTISSLVTQVQDHWQRELSKAVKVIAETGRERNALQAEVAAARAEVARLGGEFNDAIEERDTWWNNARGLLHDYEQSRAEVARLAERLRIATQALEYLSHGAETGKTARHLSTMADDALIQMSVVK
jgi:chromosome segregation ATPase